VEWNLLAGLGEEERRQVLATARRRRFRRQEVLFHEGDPAEALHLIAAGRVAVYITTPLGRTATFALLGPGEAVGELALLSPSASRAATAIALEPTETLSLRRDQFEALRSTHPSVDRLLVELLAARVRRHDADLVEAFFTPAENRVLRRLARLADQYADAGGRAVIRLTQDDLAGLTGTSRATVNRTLRGAQRQGILALRRGSVEIVDLDALRRRAR
jgi:CRP/FNR family transcriptional regulator, cyclic AMP receptor protein